AAGERQQVLLHRARRLRHEVGEDEAGQRVEPVLEGRHRRDHAEQRRGERDQREHRRVGQRARALEAAVVQEALPQEPAERAGARAFDRIHPARQPLFDARPAQSPGASVAETEPEARGIRYAGRMIEILVLYYSRNGATARLARLVARGIEEADGARARIRTVPPVAPVTTTAQPPVPEDGAPYVERRDL